jgi:hypothetical protein
MVALELMANETTKPFFYQVDLINICFHDQSLDQGIKIT